MCLSLEEFKYCNPHDHGYGYKIVKKNKDEYYPLFQFGYSGEIFTKDGVQITNWKSTVYRIGEPHLIQHSQLEITNNNLDARWRTRNKIEDLKFYIARVHLFKENAPSSFLRISEKDGNKAVLLCQYRYPIAEDIYQIAVLEITPIREIE